MSKPTILIVDDDVDFVKTTKDFLEESGFVVLSAFNGNDSIKIINKTALDVILLDKNLPDIDGLDILKNHIPQNYETIIIMVTAEPSIISSVEAIKYGAKNYIAKPYDELELLFKINKELELQRLKTENVSYKLLIDEKYLFKNIIGSNEKLEKITQTIDLLKNTDVTVLITGETGTGKNIFAHAIHQKSKRKSGKFVTINAGTLTENLLESELFGHVKGAFTGADKDKKGLFELAANGTVFIDEIGDMSYKMQIKLLRVLQDKEFEPVGSSKTIKTDIRIIAATHQNLEQLIEEKKFREDLFYRLNVVHFEIPPLRDRKDDIVNLSNHFVQKVSKKHNIPEKKISHDVINVFMEYPWPGNVRELENYIESMLILEQNDFISLDTLPVKIQNFMNKSQAHSMQNAKMEELSLDEYENRYLIYLLTKYHGKVQDISNICNVDRKTIYRKLQKYGLELTDFQMGKNTIY